ncbi:hypothetical protein DA798_08145 [Lactobacillus sp. PFC-70]|nr:hypothetical protein DA798_08145 [Lactobacillus sp. PFC-70]
MSIVTNVWTSIKKEITDFLEMPISYAVFAVALVVFVFQKQMPDVKFNGFISRPIQKMIFQFTEFFYQETHFFIICLVLIGIAAILLFLDKTVIYTYLPKPSEMTNGTTISWNYVKAVTQLFHVLLKFITIYWVWYFILHIGLNNSGGLYNSSVFIPLLIINIGELMFNVFAAIFKMSNNTQYDLIPFKDLDNFTCLSSYESEEKRICIFKPKYINKVTYVLAVESADNDYYTVVDTSNEFIAIQAHFDNLKTRHNVKYYRSKGV